MIELGSNVTIVGFKLLSPEDIETAKEIVQGFATKFSDLVPGFEKLSVNLKPVHRHEAGISKFELDAKALVRGKPYVSEVIDHDLFAGLDSVLSKVYAETERVVQKQKDIDRQF